MSCSREQIFSASALTWIICGTPAPASQPYISRSGVGDFFVEADVQVVARLIGDEQADGNSIASGGLADVDLDLSLQHTEFPQPTAIAHNHGTHGLLDLPQMTAILISGPILCTLVINSSSTNNMGTMTYAERKIPGHSTYPTTISQ